MSSVSQEATRESLLFDIGIRSAPDVIAWADRMIVKEEKPHPLLIELSTTSPERTDFVLSYLSGLKIGGDFWSALSDALSSVHDYVAAHRAEAERVAGALFFSVCCRKEKLPEEFSFLYHFDDAFYLGREGIYGSEKAVYDDFVSELRRFKKEPNQAPATVFKKQGQSEDF